MDSVCSSATNLADFLLKIIEQNTVPKHDRMIHTFAKILKNTHSKAVAHSTDTSSWTKLPDIHFVSTPSRCYRLLQYL